MATELVTDEQLRAAVATAVARFEKQPGYRDWKPALAAHIAKVQDASKEEFLSPDFQLELWESEAVSATGMGTVDVSALVSDPRIGGMLWEFRNLTLPPDREARRQQVKAAWDTLAAVIQSLLPRSPRLKMYRVFAALFPQDFTTIAHVRKLRQLANAMGLPASTSRAGVLLHSEILEKLDEALGTVPPPPSAAGVERMALPWLLYAAHIQEQGEEATVIDGPSSGSETLNPLPAARRRKGLTAVAGFLPSVRSMIDFAKDGCTREDLREHIRSVNPKLSDSSINTTINVLIAEWGVLKASGNELRLTPRGESFLETGEADELSDWLLTRILGFDHVLYELRKAPASADVLGALLQTVNPGWTTRFAPDVMIKWTIRLGLAAPDKGGLLRLTPEGLLWASRIHWVPESLHKEDAGTQLAAGEIVKPQVATDVAMRPPLDVVYAAFPATASFSKQLVARLDAGLWHNERRHFAVLTGLSGAGKTLLARSYGLALWTGQPNAGDGLCVLPVQPGWHDPSAILGYVSPLLENVYVRTGFLEFLLRAAGDPGRPYTLVLDEMNLSHPEQYLAPLLSAMETGDAIAFHTSDEEMSGVPPAIAYPANLVIIGTVNMDETTHGLSDKVLDRACVIDFWKVDVDAYPGWKGSGLEAGAESVVRDVLRKLGHALEPVRLHFGWRTVADVIGFVRSAAAAGTMGVAEALDHAIYGKILPKLRGEDTQRLRTAFRNAIEVLEAAQLGQSRAKVSELHDDLQQTGSARFWR